ncbi:hypothetical protein [Noviherbaspirillum sp.]|uniref:hypothetical protein n=1 Tax=Noviherbaspirillum sp. TaxID=1926288 RepID=UPI002FE0208C
MAQDRGASEMTRALIVVRVIWSGIRCVANRTHQGVWIVRRLVRMRACIRMKVQSPLAVHPMRASIASRLAAAF